MRGSDLGRLLYQPRPAVKIALREESQGGMMKRFALPLAPAGTPREVVARVNAGFTRVLNTAEIREKLEAQGAEVRANTPETFALFLREETARWAGVVSANGVKLE